MKYGRTIMATTVMAAVLAAAPLAARAAGTTEKVKEQAKSTTSEVKGAVSDSWITAKTKIALYSDERVKGTQVSVDTKSGVVHLRGKVDSDEAKTAAADVARGVDGVQSVKNDLQVVAPANRKAVAANDKELSTAVEHRLSRDRQLKKVDVRADAGVVTLTGKVPSITASAKASQMARAVPGVKAVKNELAFNQ